MADHTFDSLKDLYVLREALECHAARLCAGRATRHELEELALLAKQADEVIDDTNSNVPEKRFHLRLIELSGSPAMLEVFKKAHIVQSAFARINNNADTGDHDEVDERHVHARIVEAIASHDPDRAERQVRQHCASTAGALSPRWSHGNDDERHL